jgi:Bacterial Ig domain
MRRYKILFSFCVAITIIVVACSKGGTAAQDSHISDFSDSTTPVVEILNPSDNQAFRSGDTIKIDGKVTDNSLYRGSIRITNDANAAVILEQLYEIHGYQLYNFHLEYKISVSAASNYTVTVQYEDHGLNAGIKTVKVKVDP